METEQEEAMLERIDEILEEMLEKDDFNEGERTLLAEQFFNIYTSLDKEAIQDILRAMEDSFVDAQSGEDDEELRKLNEEEKEEEL